MADGGFRPAFNVELATDTGSRVIVGALVTNSGSDANQMPPMIDEIESRTGKLPGEMLVDGGFVNLDGIDKAAERGITVYAPVPAPKQEGVERYAPKPTDTKAVGEWRQRMDTDLAKEIYKERASTAETINADLSTHRALDEFSVRGTVRVLSATLLSVLTYDMLRAMALGVIT
jgi:cell division ATPase FtsA